MKIDKKQDVEPYLTVQDVCQYLKISDESVKNTDILALAHHVGYLIKLN